jgi:hypothetical protein
LAKSGSLVENRPELAKEWDLEQNSFTPDQISDRSHLKVWWICEKGHSWEAAPHSRADSETRSGTGCPTCAQEGIGQHVRAHRLKVAGVSLAEAHPDLMAEWVYELNDIDPSQLTPKSGYRAHWRCRFGHEWEATVRSRTVNGSVCPTSYQVKRSDLNRATQLRKGGVSLAEAHPDLMAEWVYELNDIDPSRLPPQSHYRAHWRCRFGHEWATRVQSRTKNGSGCPLCRRDGASAVYRHQRVHRQCVEAGDLVADPHHLDARRADGRLA